MRGLEYMAKGQRQSWVLDQEALAWTAQRSVILMWPESSISKRFINLMKYSLEVSELVQRFSNILGELGSFHLSVMAASVC